MNIRRFAALILATLLFFSFSNAHDTKGKSSKKENACCKPSSVTGKTDAKDKTGMDCCAMGKKADESKKENPAIMKEAK